MSLVGKRTIHVVCDECNRRSPKQPTTQATADYAAANKWIAPTSAHALGTHYCPDCASQLMLLAAMAAARYLGEPT